MSRYENQPGVFLAASHQIPLMIKAISLTGCRSTPGSQWVNNLLILMKGIREKFQDSNLHVDSIGFPVFANQEMVGPLLGIQLFKPQISPCSKITLKNNQKSPKTKKPALLS